MYGQIESTPTVREGYLARLLSWAESRRKRPIKIADEQPPSLEDGILGRAQQRLCLRRRNPYRACGRATPVAVKPK